MSSSAGKVLILPKGEYNNATQYQMLDAVRYNGSLYIAKKTTIGHVPADGEYWMLSAIGASDVHWGDITGSIANQSDLINALDAKQNVLTFDSTPTASSNNPVTSAGIKTALDTKQNTLTFDTTPTSGSTNPVTSEGILTAVNATASNLATIESSTTASQAYSEGDYLVLNGQLYEVIADIASGETLTVGTNISATTVGSELTALNKSLMQKYSFDNAFYLSGTDTSATVTLSKPLSELNTLLVVLMGDNYVTRAVNMLPACLLTQYPTAEHQFNVYVSGRSYVTVTYVDSTHITMRNTLDGSYCNRTYLFWA